MKRDDPKLVNLSGLGRNPFERWLWSRMAPSVERAFAIDAINALYLRIEALGQDRPFPERALEAMRVRYDVSEADRSRIPTTGSLLVVANHPFGGIEGLVLDAFLRTVRPDVKLMANFLLRAIPALHERMIFVDPFDRGESARINIAPLKACVRWLRDGGALGVFPAGAVSHLNVKRGGIADPDWSLTIARMIRMAKVPVLPVFFVGNNSLIFQTLGLVHPRLRTGLLPRELINKQDRVLPIRVGSPIPFEKLDAFEDDHELMAYLRMRTYNLRRRRPEGGTRRRLPVRNPLKRRDPAPESVVDPIEPDSMAREIARLDPAAIQCSSGPFDVIAAEADSIPACLHEIGRLREVTFRLVGEGTGRAIDLDKYDRYYLHLFVWNRDVREIVGAYRIGRTDEILRARGLNGLYTRSLFRYGRRLIRCISPALEMGRSFVRPEHQKNFAPLMLLWKGVAAYVSRNPAYSRLFGPVSISNEYQDSSRQLLAAFLKAYRSVPSLARLVRPKRPLRLDPKTWWLLRRHHAAVRDLDEVESLISDLETDLRGMPVLLRQYLRLNGRLLAFNVDPAFGNALDGLILVDLRETEPALLAKYMGREGVTSFRAYHGLDTTWDRGPKAKDE